MTFKEADKMVREDGWKLCSVEGSHHHYKHDMKSGKDVDTMKYAYPACFYKEEDGRYSVEMPDFPLATFGDDLADAMCMAADAAAGWIFLSLRDGDSIPPASNIADIKPDDETGFVSFVCVDLEAHKPNHDEASVKKTLTIPSWLNQAAERKSINFSAILKDALIERLAK